MTKLSEAGDWKASSSVQPMVIDDESKRAGTEQAVTVDATKVEAERGEEKEEGEVSLWADVGGEETL